jgi:urease accessory protein
MSVATLPSDFRQEFGGAASAGAGNAARGAAEIEFAQINGATRLKHLYQSGSLRVKFPRVGDRPPEAVLVNTAGGITGDDHFQCTVKVQAQAGAVVTTQAAEKIYRSSGGEATVDNRLTVGPDGWLVWVPQETILFDRARLRRSLVLELADGARLLAAETLVFGRQARGETVRTGTIHESWEIRRGDHLAWADVFALDGNIHEILSRPTTADGATTLITLLWVASDASDLLGPIRTLLEKSTVVASATAFDGILLVRLVAKDSFSGRQNLIPLINGLLRLANLPVELPRVWSL